MYPKIIRYTDRIKRNDHVLYHRELGEAPKLRAVRNTAVQNKHKNRLDVAMEYLAECLKNETYVNNYERKLQYGR